MRCLKSHPSLKLVVWDIYALKRTWEGTGKERSSHSHNAVNAVLQSVIVRCV